MVDKLPPQEKSRYSSHIKNRDNRENRTLRPGTDGYAAFRRSIINRFFIKNIIIQFLRNGTELQSFVYHFVEDFFSLRKFQNFFSLFSLWLELRLSEVTTVSCGIYFKSTLKGLKIDYLHPSNNK